MWVFSLLSVLCLLIKTDPVISVVFQQEYEWLNYGRLPKYSRDIDFSLSTFTIPQHTSRAQFCVSLYGSAAGEGRKILLSLRRQAIPVLQAYNETTPEDFFLPSDQQTLETNNVTSVKLTLNSPAPGRVYLVATELNPLSEVIEYLQWGEKMSGWTEMSVMANYTLRTEVKTLSVDEIAEVFSTDGPKQTYSFRVPDFTMSFSIIIVNCRHPGNSTGNATSCPVTMTTADSLYVNDSSAVSVDCRQQQPYCMLNVTSPLLERDHYVTFTFGDSADEDINMDVTFYVQGCAVGAKQYGGWQGMMGNAISSQAMYDYDTQSVVDNTSQASSSDNTSVDLTGPITPAVYRNLTGVDQSPVCLNLGHLGRESMHTTATSFSFYADFGLWTSEGDMVPHFVVAVPDFSTEVRAFSLQESLDIGGTLHIKAEIQNTTWQGVVWICAMAHRLPVNGSVDKCPGGALLTLNSTAPSNATEGEEDVGSGVFIPFPSAGTWYLAMQSQCSGPQPCEELPKVWFTVRLNQCVPNKCSRYGFCQVYTDANVVFAGCYCMAGYRGLLCTDDTYSLSDGEQLRAVYLLTLSNLAFVPAIILALYRCHFTLAAVFIFTAFFSAVYHACDTSRIFQTCIMEYSTLAFCDFFGSVLSFFSVLLFMARIPDRCRAFLLVGGALIIAVFQNDDRHSDLAHILPLATAGVILVISWILVMWKRRQLFPSKRRYLFFLLPGVVLAATGIGVNYGLMWQKSTYQYTHSFWHFSLMLAPCFLMPPRSRPPSDNKRGLSISAQDIIRIGGNEQSEPLLGHQDDDDEPAMFDASMNSINSGQNRLV